MTTEIIAISAFIFSAVSLAIGVQNYRRTRTVAGVVNNNAEAMLELVCVQESRINNVETFVYSGGGIDQRKNDGGVW